MSAFLMWSNTVKMVGSLYALSNGRALERQLWKCGSIYKWLQDGFSLGLHIFSQIAGGVIFPFNLKNKNKVLWYNRHILCLAGQEFITWLVKASKA